MFGRQKSGAVLCRSCGRLVSVRETRCPNCGAAQPALWGLTPLLRRWGHQVGFVELVLGVCSFLYLLTVLRDPAGLRALWSPSGLNLLFMGASGAAPVFGLDRWWTVLSAGWLHGGALHIVFNMMSLRQIAPALVEAMGTARTVIVFVVSSITGFLLTSTVGLFEFLPEILRGARLSVGASAGLFGVVGALIYASRRLGATRLNSYLWSMTVFMFVLGFVMTFVDNWAHLGGFVGGWLCARVMDPAKPERAQHVALALVLLVASAASLVASILLRPPGFG